MAEKTSGNRPEPIASPAVAYVADWLAKEIEFTHAAIVGVHRFAETGSDPQVQLSFMKAAARMMHAQANAALALQRLTSDNTVTIIHQKRNTPPPEISGTNRAPVAPAVVDVWEDEEFLGAPHGSHGGPPVYDAGDGI